MRLTLTWYDLAGTKRVPRAAEADLCPAAETENAPDQAPASPNPADIEPPTPESEGSVTASDESDSDPDPNATVESGSSGSTSSSPEPPPKKQKTNRGSRHRTDKKKTQHGRKLDFLHTSRAPTRSIQPAPPRRLKLPTVSASTLRRLANRAKVVAVEDVLSPKAFGGAGTSAGLFVAAHSPADYMRGVAIVAAYRAYFFPELAVQWAMYMVWLQGRAAGLTTAALKQHDELGRTLLAQYPGEYHSPADLTESIQGLLPSSTGRPAYSARPAAPYRPNTGSRQGQAGREQRASCFRWNEGRCHNGSMCRYGHRCRECGSQDHPATACQLRRRLPGNGPRPLMGLPSPAGRF